MRWNCAAIAALLLILCGCSSNTAQIEQNPPSHKRDLTRGSIPHYGEPVDVFLNTDSNTNIYFPMEVRVVKAEQNGPYKLSKDRSLLIAKAKPDLPEQGIEIEVRIKDGRKYVLRLRPNPSESPQVKSVQIDNAPVWAP